jgi:hypothetical protein
LTQAIISRIEKLLRRHKGLHQTKNCYTAKGIINSEETPMLCNVCISVSLLIFCLIVIFIFENVVLQSDAIIMYLIFHECFQCFLQTFKKLYVSLASTLVGLFLLGTKSHSLTRSLWLCSIPTRSESEGAPCLYHDGKE